ncbi:Ig-like domain-containing protein [Pseudidiomarina andamanensis]|nr:Ig-like domain-containing protein [Pseudidiomarina andamanensis]
MNISSTDAGEPLEYAAQLPISVQPQGALVGSLVSQPANGAASFSGTTLTYSPDDDFTGADSFDVRLVDEAGSPTATATVTVEVTNTAPVASVDAPNTATSGDTVRLDASGSSDADGDTLTYDWQVVSGSGVTLSGANSATASFTAPEVTTATTVQVRLIVSDGMATAEQTVSVSVTPPEKSSGAMGWLLVLLALPLVWLRRRYV